MRRCTKEKGSLLTAFFFGRFTECRRKSDKVPKISRKIQTWFFREKERRAQAARRSGFPECPPFQARPRRGGVCGSKRTQSTFTRFRFPFRSPNSPADCLPERAAIGAIPAVCTKEKRRSTPSFFMCFILNS